MDPNLSQGGGPRLSQGRGSRLSWRPSRRKCLCLFMFFLSCPSKDQGRDFEHQLQGHELSIHPLGGSRSQIARKCLCLLFFFLFLAVKLLAVSQRPLTLILLQKYRDTNGRRIAIQIGGVNTTFCQEEGIHLQKYHHRNGRCIAILFKSIGVRGRFDSPENFRTVLHKGPPLQGSRS